MYADKPLRVTAVPFFASPPQRSILPFLYPSVVLPSTLQQHRFISFRDLNPFRRKERKFIDPLDPDFAKRSPAASRPPPPNQVQGDLAPGSILDEAAPATAPGKADGKTQKGPRPRDPAIMAAALDPDPVSRIAYERRMVMKNVRNSRVPPTKAQILARTERQSMSKSPLIKTSMKKLMPLARQIAGKPIDEAIVQMRYSTKKAAADVRKHLEFARDEAIVKRGMGLGPAQRKIMAREQQQGGAVVVKHSDGETRTENVNDENNLEDERDLEMVREPDREGWYVEDRDGHKRWVEDQTDIYVDQAWVTKGPYEQGTLHRARGRVDRLMKPWTGPSPLPFLSTREIRFYTDAAQGIALILKEEKTRMRLMGEREEKRTRKKVWVQMPNRPVTAQRQYNLW